jgi:23S rRNA (adenine2030-N6)-methyltransferase
LKYRHAHHAGNFADVHKHVTLLALLAALCRKDKGFLYLETHAGRGAYGTSGPAGEAANGIGRLDAQAAAGGTGEAQEIRHYMACVARLRRERGDSRLYPGSPLLAAAELRPQDRGIFIERVPAEARALVKALPHCGATAQRLRVETGDGFALLRAWLPPPERRGLTFIDPPYEESRQDFERARQAAGEALRRFRTGVVAVWYPIKDERDTAAWQATLAAGLDCELLVGELSLYPRDSRVALNGSGMLVLNPPYQLAQRMQVWLPRLHACLDLGHGGGASVRQLGAEAGTEP